MKLRLLKLASLLALALSVQLVHAQSTTGGSSGSAGSSSGSSSSDDSKDPGSAVNSALCTGKMFNPLSDPDWNNLFPMTVSGANITTGGRTNPPTMYNRPLCECVEIFTGSTTVGVPYTMWQPMFLAEADFRPGCSATLGGKQLLSGKYARKRSEEQDDGAEGGQTNLKHVHWMSYPVYALVAEVINSPCYKKSDFAMAYMTEPDPAWNSDAYAAILSPEASLFATPLAQAACAVDAVAANVHYPLDPLFWCAGSWGSIYPLSGNAGTTNGLNQINNLAIAKFIAKNFRTMQLWQTIGPSAICSSHPNPIIVKTQFRFNQIAPLVRRGAVQSLGSLGVGLSPLISNFPSTGENTAHLIWQASQCCVRIP